MNEKQGTMKTGEQHGSKTSVMLGLIKRALPHHRGSVLPGFGLALGFTLLYLADVVLVPLSRRCS